MRKCANDWFPIYAGDLLHDIKFSRLSLEEQAIAVRLWCISWINGGPLPNSANDLCRLIGYGVEVATLNHVLSELFELRGDTGGVERGEWISPRLEEERTIAQANHEAKVRGGRKSWKTRKLRGGVQRKDNSVELMQTGKVRYGKVRYSVVSSKKSYPEETGSSKTDPEQHTEGLALLPEAEEGEVSVKDPLLKLAIASWRKHYGGGPPTKLEIGHLRRFVRQLGAVAPKRGWTDEMPECVDAVIRTYVGMTLKQGEYTPSTAWLEKRWTVHFLDRRENA